MPDSTSRRARTRKSSGPGRRRAISEYVALGLMALHLLLAPMLFGGALAWTVICIAASAFIALGATAYTFRRSLSIPSPAIVWGALGLLVWTSLQALPMPCGLVAHFAPESAHSARAAQQALGAPGGVVCTLSRDPGATLVEIVKGFAIVATLAAAWLFGVNGSRRNVLWMIASSTLAMSVVALGHALAGLDRVFGFYKPVETGNQLLLAPLMNSNNLGAFAALGVPLWIGLTYRARSRELRWLGRAGILITAATAILSLSRGAIGQLGLGALMMVVCIRVASRNASRPDLGLRRRNLAIALAVVAACGVAMYVAGQLVTTELANRDVSKLRLMQRSLAFAWNHFWVGVGRGAFSSAFAAVEGQTVRFAYPENFLIQWASEWGFPITVLWVVLVGIALVHAVRESKSLVRLAALAALLAYCAQNLVDLGFELVGIAVVAAALLGATTAPRKHEKSPAHAPSRLVFSVGAVLFAGTLILVTLAPRAPTASVTSLDAHLREQMRVQDRTGFRRTLTRALSLHPAEPLFSVVAATEALKHDDPRTGRWINHAMQLAPNWAAPHVLAFKWLWRVGQRDQALVELQQAVEIDPLPWKAEFCSLVGRKGSPAMVAAPRGKWRAVYLEMASSCVEPGHPAAEPIDAALMREFPDRPLAFEWSAYRLASRGHVDEGLELMDKLLARQPDNPRARATRAEMLLAAGRAHETVEQVEHDLRLAPTDYFKLWLLRSQGRAYAQLGDVAGVHRVVREYRALSAGSVQGLADSYAFEASVQLVLQNPNSALAAYREAYSVDPQTSYLLQVADIAGRLGDRPQMIWAYVQLCAREPLNGAYCATRDQILAPRPRDVR